MCCVMGLLEYSEAFRAGYTEPDFFIRVLKIQKIVLS
jgi:hypothetical protein